MLRSTSARVTPRYRCDAPRRRPHVPRPLLCTDLPEAPILSPRSQSCRSCQTRTGRVRHWHSARRDSAQPLHCSASHARCTSPSADCGPQAALCSAQCARWHSLEQYETLLHRSHVFSLRRGRSHVAHRHRASKRSIRCSSRLSALLGRACAASLTAPALSRMSATL